MVLYLATLRLRNCYVLLILSYLGCNGFGKTFRVTGSFLLVSKNERGPAGHWTKVYRVSNSTWADKAGTWAHKNYWNAGGYSTQTIKPSYDFGGGDMGKDPTYCSKIVWQAYRIGVGQANVINTPFSLVLPYNLPDYFVTKPSLVTTFKK